MRSWTLKQQGKAQGAKLGNPIPAALPRKLGAFHWEPRGQGWAHTVLCRASALVQEGCRRMPPVGGSVWVYLDAAGAAVSVLPTPGALVTSLDGAPSGLTLLWLLWKPSG